MTPQERAEKILNVYKPVGPINESHAYLVKQIEEAEKEALDKQEKRFAKVLDEAIKMYREQARAEALEEAAKVDSIQMPEYYDDWTSDQKYWFKKGIDHTLFSIRALKTRCQHDVDGKDCFECFPSKRTE